MSYMYPITIKRDRQVVSFEEVREIDRSRLSDLQFVGSDKFDIEDRFPVGYVVTVYRSRLETDNELNTRVAGEERYMVEYNKRHPSK